MILFKKVPFTFEEQNYEIRVLYDEQLITIATFHNNYPCNGFRHHIQISKKLSVSDILQRQVIDEIIEIAKRDILEKRWERLLEQS